MKTFTYDPIGNLLSKSDVGTYTYPLAGSALPHAVSVINGSITQGSATLFFSHDIDHQRFKQQAPEGTTTYFDAFGVHAELFGTSWYDYVSAGGAMLGVRVLHSDLSVTTSSGPPPPSTV